MEERMHSAAAYLVRTYWALQIMAVVNGLSIYGPLRKVAEMVGRPYLDQDCLIMHNSYPLF